jgi:hypothetical protein
LSGLVPRDVDINRNVIKKWEDIGYLKAYAFDAGCADIILTPTIVLADETKSINMTRTYRSFHKIRTVGKQLHFMHQWLSKTTSPEEWIDIINDRDVGEYIMHENLINIKGNKEGLHDLTAYRLGSYVPFCTTLYTAGIQELKNALASVLTDDKNNDFASLKMADITVNYRDMFASKSSFDIMYFEILKTSIKLDILRQMYIIDNSVQKDDDIEIKQVAYTTGTMGQQHFGSHDYLTNVIRPILQKLLDDNDYLDPRHEDFAELFYRDFYMRIASTRKNTGIITKVLQSKQIAALIATATENPEEDPNTQQEYEDDVGDGLIEEITEVDAEGEPIETENLDDDYLDGAGNNMGGEIEAEDAEAYLED